MQDSAKQQFAEELFSYSDTFNKVNYSAFTSKGDVPDEVGECWLQMLRNEGKMKKRRKPGS